MTMMAMTAANSSATLLIVCLLALLRFILGEGGFIPAIHQAVVGLKEGEEKEVVIAPSDAFGPCEYCYCCITITTTIIRPPYLPTGLLLEAAVG